MKRYPLWVAFFMGKTIIFLLFKAKLKLYPLFEGCMLERGE
jgi:hypothetical protein